MTKRAQKISDEFTTNGLFPTYGGKGTIELNMSFMEKVETECSECGGSRYRHDKEFW